MLGDLVGYGGEPNAVIDRIRALDPVAIIRGNHDKVACGLDDASNFNQSRKYCGDVDRRGADRRQPRVPARPAAGPVLIDERVEICHGSPFDEDHYIFDADDAPARDGDQRAQLCLFGHTHLPVVFRRDGGELRWVRA